MPAKTCPFACLFIFAEYGTFLEGLAELICQLGYINNFHTFFVLCMYQSVTPNVNKQNH